ncbi:MAG: arsenite/tail-anchored protein-transporting ATPase [Blastococcus sp.]|nr:arsenite/tail-anchored protein-transporting ATPase [Blastococcus sp.]
MRTLLFTGPGGAGTTTSAAAAAVRAARAGRRTLLLSRQPVPVAGLDTVPGLQVRTADPQGGFEGLWQTVAGPVAAVLPRVSLPPTSSVVPLPGAGVLALFAELAGADADLVVVDAGPVSDATELVGLSATLRWWLDQILPPGMRALAAVRTAAVASKMAQRGPVDAALAAVPVVERLLRSDRLADPADTAVVLATQPRSGTAVVLRRTALVLGLHGLRPAEVLARVLPEGDGDWWAGRLAEQEAALAELADFGSLRRVPELAAAPADAMAVAELIPDLEPVAAEPLVPVTERRDGIWQLIVPLPFAQRPDVDLTRWEDDVVITVAGARRSIGLDPLLRRCEVTGARMEAPGTAAARLVVSFQPDPQHWPAELLAAEGRRRP